MNRRSRDNSSPSHRRSRSRRRKNRREKSSSSSSSQYDHDKGRKFRESRKRRKNSSASSSCSSHSYSSIKENIKKRAKLGERSQTSTNGSQKTEKPTAEIANISPAKNEKKDVLPSMAECVDNVLEIPELYRVNFALSDVCRIEECHVGQKFWYAERWAKYTKYLIRLHNDGEYLDPDRLFVLKTQVGLQWPKTSQVNIHDLVLNIRQNAREKEIGKLKKVRIMLDVRDFSVLFSPSPFQSEYVLTAFQTLLGHSVTHFVFDGHQDCPVALNKITVPSFLTFILLHLPNLEYLAVGNAELDNQIDGEKKLGSEVKGKKLKRLKTVRLLQFTLPLPVQRKTFAVTLMENILERSPNLRNIYGLPFPLYNLLRKKQKKKDRNSGGSPVISKICRSFILQRDLYPSWYEEAGTKYLDHLSSYYRSAKVRGRGRGQGQCLEEFSTQVFFVPNQKIREQCVKKMSKILRLCQKSLVKLRLEPKAERAPMLTFPVMENVKVLQLNIPRTARMKRMESDPGKHGGLYFFPRDLDIKRTFPSLNKVEIFLDKQTDKNCSYYKNPKSKVYQTNLWTLFNLHFPSDIFEPGPTGDSVFEKVHSLSLFHFCPYACIPRLSQLFPNLRALQLVHDLDEVAQTLPIVYKVWPKLIQLTIEVKMGTNHLGPWTLDPAFTGYPITLCKAVESSQYSLKLEDKSRLKLPISHLTDLRLLRIILRQPTGPHEIVLPFSRLSILYGFGPARMPKLKVFVGLPDRMDPKEKQAIKELLTPGQHDVQLDR